MGRPKTKQKNTLALWVGVQPGSSTSSKTSRILVFKVDCEKLRRCQSLTNVLLHRTSTAKARASSEDTLSDDDIFRKQASGHLRSRDNESVATSLDLDTAQHIAPREMKAIHPFFSTVRLGSSGALYTDVPKHDVEPHDFFRPRSSHQLVPRGGSSMARTCGMRAQEPPLPSRTCMHVHEDFITLAHLLHNPLKRKRYTPPQGVAAREIRWQESAWLKSTLSKSRRPFIRTPPATEQLPSAGHYRPEVVIRHIHPALQRISNYNHEHASACNLWTNKYAPMTADHVLQTGKEPAIFRDWLRTRHVLSKDRLHFATRKSNNGQSRYADEYDDFIVDADANADADIPLTSDIGTQFNEKDISCPAGREILFRSNLVVITGPHGCGKSALIQAVANELNFEIFEVNSSDRRNGKDIVDLVGEAADSHIVNKQKSASGEASLSLLLFEEVDVLYREDKDFWNALLHLISRSRRPVILTCNDTSMLPHQLDIHSIFLEMSAPPMDLLCKYLNLIQAQEAVHIDGLRVQNFLKLHNRDLRASINFLQFESLGKSKLSDDLSDRIDTITTQNAVPLISLYMQDNDLTCQKRITKSFHSRFTFYLDGLSTIDVLGAQQRTNAFEAPEIYENDTEEFTARPLERDDIIGRQILSEPLGRYTPHYPGDLDLCIPIALLLHNIHLKALRSTYPVWYLPDFPSENTQLERICDGNWANMQDACDPFSVPENWMHETIPHNSIDRPRGSGILAAEVLPALRDIVRIENHRKRWEQLYLSGPGRHTRNTISAEFGMAYMRPPKIPESMRPGILATFWQ